MELAFGEFIGDLLFVDIAWHTTDLEISGLSYEKNLQFGGVPPNPDWRPKTRHRSP